MEILRSLDSLTRGREYAARTKHGQNATCVQAFYVQGEGSRQTDRREQSTRASATASVFMELRRGSKAPR